MFGALRHINTTGVVKKKSERQFVDPDWTQDDGDKPPKWSINRRVLPSELEVEYQTTPFETYPLTRGKKNGILGSSLKVVGKFKGLIRVMMSENEPSLLPKELLDSLLKPKGYKVRLYVLNVMKITGVDRDMFGKPAKSDPYLKVFILFISCNILVCFVYGVVYCVVYCVVFVIILVGTSRQRKLQ